MKNQITPGQKISVLRLCKNFTRDRECRMYIISKMIGRKVYSTNQLTHDDWELIKDLAYDHWMEDDWTVSDKFYQLGNRLSMQYQEDILGQETIFK